MKKLTLNDPPWMRLEDAIDALNKAIYKKQKQGCGRICLSRDLGEELQELVDAAAGVMAYSYEIRQIGSRLAMLELRDFEEENLSLGEGFKWRSINGVMARTWQIKNPYRAYGLRCIVSIPLRELESIPPFWCDVRFEFMFPPEDPTFFTTPYPIVATEGSWIADENF